MKTFAELGIPQNLIQGIEELGIKQPTAIQLQAIPFLIKDGGDLMQKERDKVMRAFKKERVQFLIATDVAARGIDVEGLSFVIHHQLPEQVEYFTHRSGRTARAGKKGISLVLIEPRERNTINQLAQQFDLQFRELA